MINLPNEIINIILSYRNKHPIAIIIDYLIYDCYMKDFDPYIHYFYIEMYCNIMSFNQWYFYIIRKYNIKLTRPKLKIGIDKFDRCL